MKQDNKLSLTFMKTQLTATRGKNVYQQGLSKHKKKQKRKK